MNRPVIARLILKDWYLSRTLLILIAAAGTLSIGLLYLRRDDTGAVGLISAVIACVLLSILLPMQTVVNERKQHNLAFVMSSHFADGVPRRGRGQSSAFLALWAAITIGVLGTSPAPASSAASVHSGWSWRWRPSWSSVSCCRSRSSWNPRCGPC